MEPACYFVVPCIVACTGAASAEAACKEKSWHHPRPERAHHTCARAGMTDKARAALAAALDDVSADRDALEGAGPLRTVHGGAYIILEMLGKGAYGAVYKARRWVRVRRRGALEVCRS